MHCFKLYGMRPKSRELNCLRVVHLILQQWGVFQLFLFVPTLFVDWWWNQKKRQIMIEISCWACARQQNSRLIMIQTIKVYKQQRFRHTHLYEIICKPLWNIFTEPVSRSARRAVLWQVPNLDLAEFGLVLQMFPFGQTWHNWVIEPLSPRTMFPLTVILNHKNLTVRLFIAVSVWRADSPTSVLMASLTDSERLRKLLSGVGKWCK
jgi:hypothetical protein